MSRQAANRRPLTRDALPGIFALVPWERRESRREGMPRYHRFSHDASRHASPRPLPPSCDAP